MNKRAALYARVSTSDEDDDRTDRQLARLRDFARDQGYDVAAEYEDDGVSAFKSNVRPAYAGLLTGLGDGRFDVVCAVSVDRISRRSLDIEALKLAVVKSKAVIHTINGGLFDPAQGMSSAMLTMMGAVGELESAEKSNRTRAARENLAAQGKPGPAPRRFGYESNGMTPRESEATLIRAAYDAILERGETYYSVAKLWQSRKVKRRSGRSDWNGERVREVLTRPAVAGLLVVNGERQPKSLITPLVTESQWAEMNTRTRGHVKRGSKPKHPLSGVLLCPCGVACIASKRNGLPVYRCRASMQGGSRGRHVSMRSEWALDEAVEGLWRVLLDGPVEDQPDNRDALRAALETQAELSRRKRHATELRLDPDVDQHTVRAMLRDLSRELEAVAGEIEHLQSDEFDADLRQTVQIARRVRRRGKKFFHPAYSEVTLPGESIEDSQRERFRDAFDALTVDQQRSLFRGVAVATLRPGRGRGRVEVVRRTGRG